VCGCVRGSAVDAVRCVCRWCVEAKIARCVREFQTHTSLREARTLHSFRHFFLWILSLPLSPRSLRRPHLPCTLRSGNTFLWHARSTVRLWFDRTHTAARLCIVWYMVKCGGDIHGSGPRDRVSRTLDLADALSHPWP
jgi:hypothetical protein